MKRMNPRLPSVLWASLVAATLLFPNIAHAAGFTLEGFYGLSRPPDTSVENALDDPDLFDDTLQLAGGDVLIRLGLFEFGAIADVTWDDNAPSQTYVGGLAGIALPLGGVRIDLLGEIGGHRFGNLARNPDIVTASDRDQWLAYVGLRPGLAFKVGSPDRPGLLVGVWTFARWDLQKENVPVTLEGGGDGDVELGGVTLGATLRLGVDF